MRAKCKAKNPALCVDPQCPEKMYLKNAFNNALKNGDFNAFMEAKDQEAFLEPERIYPNRGLETWDRVIVHNKKDDTYFGVGIEPLQTVTYSKDMSTIPTFESWEQIADYFNDDKQVTLRIYKTGDYRFPYEVEGFYIQDFYVSKDLRGQGVGQYIMTAMTQQADKENVVIELVPTEAGDGKTQDGEPGHKERAMAHQKRLIKFYERHGFVLNPFYWYADKEDYLTNEPRVIDQEARDKFTKKAANELKHHSMYIRYPNGQYPKGWLK